MTAHSFRLQLRFDIIKRIEILYFAGNAAFETGCIKTGNRTNPAFARHNRFPKSLKASSVRRQNTHAGNDGAISFHNLSLLGRATVREDKAANWTRRRMT